MLKKFQSLLLQYIFITTITAQTVAVGSGSYTTQFPGTDVAGRNAYPSGVPYLIDSLKSKPVPTNDWWSAKLKNAHCDNLFNYPLTMKTVNSGLVTTYIPWGVISDIEPITVGVENMNCSAPYISAYSDWNTTIEWKSGNQQFQANIGMGMPFVYYQKDANSIAQIKISNGTVTIKEEKIIIENAYNGADFVVYAPKGSKWNKNGTLYTSALNNQNYWSVLMLPQNSSNLTALADSFHKYAYVEPIQTTANWKFNNTNNELTTNFNIHVTVHEGTDSLPLIGLLPHHWANTNQNSSKFLNFYYASIRGKLKMLAATSFEVKHIFKGILPTLPYVDYRSENFDPNLLKQKIDAIKNEGLSTWTDSYNEGQVLNRLIQTARIAHEMGDENALKTILTTVKNRLENWLTYQPKEVAFLFYYNKTWSSLIGYPAGHGQDNNINDHHFHWGYFIHAASFIEEFEPGWANKYGQMINLLVRDAASPERKDTLFPYLRNFNPYTGHCWANGFATFPQGNDQESTSESMQFNSSLIHWGSITNNNQIRNLGIYLYCTEQSAIDEYWFDKNKRNFGTTQNYALVSRLWGNSYDNGTFWTNDIAASYGIELYPIHGGSFYLAHDSAYTQKLWNEMAKNTGILSNQVNDNLWHDVYWSFLTFYDPAKAIQLYNSNPNRNLKFGISDAQTYHWLHAMNSLGKLQPNITSNHPFAVAFKKGNKTIYSGKNYSNDSIKVTFSDGYSFIIPPKKLITSLDIPEKAVIKTDFSQLYKGSDINIYFDTLGFTPDSIQWYMGSQRINNNKTTITIKNLNPGKYNFYSKLFLNGDSKLSNALTIIIGEQKPYNQVPFSIPGSIQPGLYDKFEGGIGQDISYSDNNTTNLGDFRTQESVDASTNPIEGSIVTWIEPNEWLEYSTNIQKSGIYSCNIRFANGNTSTSGNLEIWLDSSQITKDIQFPSTQKWENFSTINLNNLTLLEGRRILKLFFKDGGMNLGKITFTYVSGLTTKFPIANAGRNQTVKSATDTIFLDGTLSSMGDLGYIHYNWKQIYGPNKLTFTKPLEAYTSASNFIQGVYKIRLTVSDSLNTDYQDIFIFVQDSGNIKPDITINSPTNNQVFIEGQKITLSAFAEDLDGQISTVKFLLNSKLVKSDSTYPYDFIAQLKAGDYQIYTVAFDDNNDSSVSSTYKFSVVDISGNWQLEPIAAAMAVGPNENTLNWWSNSLSDVKTRSCLFDDVYQINTDGTFRNILGAETWLENWQNAGTEGCYSPKSPYNGMDTGKWEIDSISNELIIHGNGQYLGLPKVTNQGEMGNGATEPNFRKYRISLTGNKLTTGINFGSGYWQFKFIKTNSTATAANPKAGNSMIIFPNPAANQIQIEYAGKIWAIRITDIYGKTLIQTHNRTINISALKAAPYFIQIETENGIIVNRFMKASE